jgi:hypothetical protein
MYHISTVKINIFLQLVNYCHNFRESNISRKTRMTHIKHNCISKAITLRLIFIKSSHIPNGLYSWKIQQNCVYNYRFPHANYIIFSLCGNILYLLTCYGIAQAVRRRFPTAAGRVQNRVWSCGILWWTKVALGQVFFSENFGFPCQSTFHLLLHNHLHYHPRLA